MEQNPSQGPLRVQSAPGARFQIQVPLRRRTKRSKHALGHPFAILGQSAVFHLRGRVTSYYLPQKPEANAFQAPSATLRVCLYLRHPRS